MIITSGSSLPEIIILLLGLITVALLYFKHAYSYWSKRNVFTIPPDIPFGNFRPFILQRKFIGENLAYLYNQVKHTGRPYVGLYMTWRPVLLLLDPELCKIVLTKEFQHFSSRSEDIDEEKDPLAAHLVNLNGNKWKFMRSKLTPTFSSGKMKMMFHTLLSCSEELNVYLAAHEKSEEPLEIKEVMARFTTDIIASCAFGIECNSLKEPDNVFRKQGKRVFELSRWDFVRTLIVRNLPKIAALLRLQRSSEETHLFFMNLVRQTVEYRENNNVSRKDFLELLIQLKNKGYVEDTNGEKGETLKSFAT